MGYSAGFELENELMDRFWYWTGASGKRYIHSIYTADNCPPLPGAIYIVVQRHEAGTRIPVRIGRFSPLWDFPLPADFAGPGYEVHVHLLAGSGCATASAFDDLEASLGFDENRDITESAAERPVGTTGFTEQSLPLFAGLAA